MLPITKASRELMGSQNDIASMVLPVKTPSGSRPPSPLAAIVVTVGMNTAIGAKAPNSMSAERIVLVVSGLIDWKVRSEKRKGPERSTAAPCNRQNESSQASNGGCARQTKSRGLGTSSMRELTGLLPAQVVGDPSPAHPARHVHRGQPNQVRRSEPAAHQRRRLGPAQKTFGWPLTT